MNPAAYRTRLVLLDLWRRICEPGPSRADAVSGPAHYVRLPERRLLGAPPERLIVDYVKEREVTKP